MNKKVCLITPGHISTNPRLVKEAIALTKAGYKTHIVFTQYMNYLLEEDSRILKANPSITFDCLNWTNNSLESKFNRVSTRLYQKLCIKLNRKKSDIKFQQIILNRNFHWQLKTSVKSKANLYIAHNAGALAIAHDAALINNQVFSYDAEDYHRGELLSEEFLLATITVENTYLSRANYITAASPLIANEYKQLLNRDIFTVNNVFSLSDSHRDLSFKSNTLKLFWFSQTIGTNRGIQDVIKAMKLLEGKDIEFHLYGLLPEATKNEFDQLVAKLQFNTKPKILYNLPLDPQSLLKKASEFDIGLAIEPGFCLNNKIALSNKIFTYLLGGNTIVFSNTPAQKKFFNEHPGVGEIYEPGNHISLSEILLKYYNDRMLLQEQAKNSTNLFEEKLNWEIESGIFLDCVKNSFN